MSTFFPIKKAVSKISEKYASLPYSLNFSKRKKDFQRIETDNLALAKRLIQRKSYIDLDSMSKDFEKHCNYKKIMMKLPLAPNKHMYF